MNWWGNCRACGGELQIYNIRGICIATCNCHDPLFSQEYDHAQAT